MRRELHRAVEQLPEPPEELTGELIVITDHWSTKLIGKFFCRRISKIEPSGTVGEEPVDSLGNFRALNIVAFVLMEVEGHMQSLIAQRPVIE